MRVMKFGGTSVRDAERIGQAADLVVAASAEDEVCVVVSALGGLTDQLLSTAEASAHGETVFVDNCREMRKRHLEAAAGLAEDADLAKLNDLIDRRFDDLARVLEGISLVRECSPRTLDKVLSVGELLSSALVAAALRRRGLQARACDARQLVRTNSTFGAGRVDFETTYEIVRAHFEAAEETQVVTGFLASNAEGETTTLGRGGSDYTASLLGAALDVDRIEIWTDVDGVLSTDPRAVDNAFSLDSLSYDELLELSHFGAKVVFPPTVHPARRRSIPLLIRNTLNPSFPGTRVDEAVEPGPHPIRGISAIPRVALLRLQGDGIAGVPGAARRLFQALAGAGINVILISQASSEHSICLAVEPDKADLARTRVHEEFARERSEGLVDDLVVDHDFAVVAVVGAGMSHRPGISGRLFGSLGAAGINVHAIAQGSSELNISFACASVDQEKVLNVLHSAFFSPDIAHLVLLGVGGVGGELLNQLRSTIPEGTLSLTGVANSRRMSLCSERRDPDRWTPDLLQEADSRESDLEEIRDFAVSRPGRRVLVDCTASDATQALYPSLLKHGVSIVTANKKPVAADLETWRTIRDAAAEGTGRLFYEATAGAGLPVVGTLQALVETGDRVDRIEGLFSGTLGYLMTRLREGSSFSEAVRDAHAAGYTEPDPREDLSGIDVARKLLILVRLCGEEAELEDMGAESLLPSTDWDALSQEDFFDRLPELDEPIAARVEGARDRGRALTYLARWQRDEGASVDLTEVEADHPVAAVTGTDNLFAFTTQRYSSRPLVVIGPGAGREVTAAGVYSDVLQALRKDDRP